MKIKLLLPIILILGIGVVVGGLILNMDTASLSNNPHEPASDSEPVDAIPRGPHGGWQFSKNELRVDGDQRHQAKFNPSGGLIQ